MTTGTVNVTPTAADLCRDYLAALERRDVDAVMALLAPDAESDFPFAPEGIQQTYLGDEVRGFIDLVIGRLLTEVKIVHSELFEVSDGLVFAELRSDCTTRKGLKYQNRYVVKVQAEGGRITLWREYFDPRATSTVR
jgi:ketosteroid isomerase-like protein